MGFSVKPLTHWVIYKGYKVRFKERSPARVTGVLTTPTGEVEFVYEPTGKVVTLPDMRVTINDYGWELEKVTSDEANGEG
ncbi:MAG: hypothetical protein DYG89_47930 [Caldilinea sp. CFX5]|nr:hypothetical protein [Caldilinea sp. CFX5]